MNAMKTFISSVLFLFQMFLICHPELSGSTAASYQTSEHSIESEGVRLKARFYKPLSSLSTDNIPVVVMVSGSGSDDTTADPYTKMLVKPWVKAGIGVLTFNKRGAGQSGGTHSETDFDQRARDVVNVLEFARQLPGIDDENIGLWGISQAGWVIPKVIRRVADIRFVIMVSPAGVSPVRQVEFYMENEFRKLGLSGDELVKAAKLNHAIMNYYGRQKGYEEASKLLAQAAKESWYLKIRKHPFWHDMPVPDRLYSPEELNAAINHRAKDFSWYLADSTFENYSDDYRKMSVPLLIIYGGRDQLVPVQESIALFKESMDGGSSADVTFRIFEEGDHSLQISPTELVAGYTHEMTEWILKRIRTS